MTTHEAENLVRHFCIRDDLATYDPYDVWKTGLGFRVKQLFHRHEYLGLLPAAALAGADTFLNNGSRLFYTRQEYPIVRAFACLSLLSLWRHAARPEYLAAAQAHLRWLVTNRCSGYHGYGWGLGFDYPVDRDIVYDRNTPFATVTPYVLEALVGVAELTGTTEWDFAIRRVYDFFEQDIQIMEDAADYLVTSYGPTRDRVVTNAISYTMYSYSLLLAYLQADERKDVSEKIRRLYRFLVTSQQADGSWRYSPRGRSFVDCFHSCIVLKNIIKTNGRLPLEDSNAVTGRGYEYLKTAFWDDEHYLFRRFLEQKRPSPIQFDLYDNAEMLSLACLMKDCDLARRLLSAIAVSFVDRQNVYSQIDVFGVKRNKNTLRWAVLPLVYALSRWCEYNDGKEALC